MTTPRLETTSESYAQRVMRRINQAADDYDTPEDRFGVRALAGVIERSPKPDKIARVIENKILRGDYLGHLKERYEATE